MEPTKTASFFAALFTSAALAGPVVAQARTPAPPAEKPAPPVMTPEDIKAQYTKYEYRIAMRDGKKLFTAVYVPKDDSIAYPILMTRTPYSCRPYGVDQYKTDLGPSVHFSKAAYIFVYQDVRGRWLSEGEHVNMRPHNPKKGPQDIDESTD